MDREDRERAFRRQQTGKQTSVYLRSEVGNVRTQNVRDQEKTDERPATRREKELLRQAARRRQIRNRSILLVVALLVVVAIVAFVTGLGKEKETSETEGADGIQAEQVDGTPEVNQTEEDTEEGSSAESEEEPSTQSEAEQKTAYLRELQTRIPAHVRQEFLPINEFSRPCIALSQINNIVIHYVGNPGTSADGNLGYFRQLANQVPSEDATMASSNFIVGLEGEVIQCMPIYEMAYCSNSRNWDTLSIEVCHPDVGGKFNDVTYQSLVQLCAWLCKELDLTEKDLIRHYDVTKKKCPLYYVDHPEAWEQLKADVGAALSAME